MYHPGRVLRVFRGGKDNTGDGVQAMVDMWDQNLFTFLVDERIAEKVKEGDVVLVDYSPAGANSPHLRRVIVKVLHGKAASETWQRYGTFHKEQKSKEGTRQEHDYMG